MSIEIFKNNQDQVLFGSSGNIFKRPYNFGNEFASPIRAQYLEIPTLLGVDVRGWSFNLWGKLKAVRYPVFYIENSDESAVLDVFEQYMKHPADQVPLWEHYRNGVLIPSQLGTGDILNFCTFNSLHAISFVLTECRMGSLGVRGSDNNETSCNLLTIFDRNLSKLEHEFMFNNYGGNDLLSTLGLQCKIDFNLPKIDGTDIIFEDMSGNNNHAVFRGLPAGTPSEQLQYVKDNLIVQW